MDTIWTYFLGHEVRQTFYSAGGIRTRAIEAGDGPPLIFIHGQGGHAENFAHNVVAHSKHFHVYAIDLVGHGFSDRPTNLKYDVGDYVNQVVAFLDAIGARTAHLSGQSMGALVASWVAADHPERVERMVLTTGIPHQPDEKGKRQYADGLERSRKAAGTPTLETLQKRMQMLTLSPESITDEIINVRLAIYSQPGAGDSLRRAAEGYIGPLADPNGHSKWHDQEVLQRVKCPTLVVWTHHNPGQGLQVAQEAFKFLPNGKMVVFENSAHWPQWEEPEKYNRISIDFLLGKGVE